MMDGNISQVSIYYVIQHMIFMNFSLSNAFILYRRIFCNMKYWAQRVTEYFLKKSYYGVVIKNRVIFPQ